mgnify:CR=1 FL=1
MFSTLANLLAANGDASTISVLGRGLVMSSLLFATFGCVLGFVAGARYSKRAWNLTWWSAVASARVWTNAAAAGPRSQPWASS